MPYIEVELGVKLFVQDCGMITQTDKSLCWILELTYLAIKALGTFKPTPHLTVVLLLNKGLLGGIAYYG